MNNDFHARVKTGPENREKGFSLLELLVAVVLFSLVVVVATGALWKTIHRFQEEDLLNHDERREYFHLYWLRGSFLGLMNYRVKNERKKDAPFFEGNLKEIRYISSAPVIGVLPVAVRLRVRQDEETGKFDLEYSEIEVYAKTYDELKDLFTSSSLFEKKGRSFNVFQDLDRVAFRFFGRKTNSQREGEWSTSYSSLETRLLPEKITLKCEKGDKKVAVTFFISYRGAWY